MKPFALLVAFILIHFTASADILIFDGPAPLKTFGTDFSVRRNRAVLVYDTTVGQVGIINYYGGRGSGRGEQMFLASFPVDGGTVSLKRGSITVLSGVTRSNAESPDFQTQMVSFRGRNTLLNRTTDLTGPRVLNGIARTTSRSGTTVSHLEQSLSLIYQAKLSNAANIANEPFEDALERVSADLERRGFDLAPRN